MPHDFIVAITVTSVGPWCTCLQVDPTAGARGGPDVLVALAQYRRKGGRLHFGVLLAAVAGQATGPCHLPGAVASTAGGAGSLAAGRHGAARDADTLDAAWLAQCHSLVLRVGDPVLPVAGA